MTEIAQLTAFRRALHRAPELSGQEQDTARAVLAFTAAAAPDATLTGLGGHGVALEFTGAAPGPTVMIRCELDALPIAERSSAPHRSARPGLGHLCGHDGHMAILAGLALRLGARRPARGRVVLLFQPAEETGAGAAAVLADPRFAAIAPDYAFAIHNLPGLPTGAFVLNPGPANCASVGLRLVFGGRTSHAAEPHKAITPALALAGLMPALLALGPGGDLTPDFRLVTLTHLRMGEPAFGITPGAAELWVTLRSLTDAGMAGLKAAALHLAETAARDHGLTLGHDWHDDFAACQNDPQATALFRVAVASAGLALHPGQGPMRASEDFGRFAAHARCAMAFLGAGEATPPLHAPDYDFPDTLIAPALTAFTRLVRDLCG